MRAMSDSPPAAGNAAQPHQNATILMLSAAAFFSGAALRVCDSLLPRLARDFDRTPGAAGRVIISFAMAYGLMQLLFGPLGDRYGKARMVCVALFGCIAGSLACAFAPSFDSLVVLRVVWGMAAAGVIPLAMAWIGDTVPYERRQATLAQLLTGTLGGMMAGQLAGGLFADSRFGWRGAFLTLSAGYAVVAVMLLVMLRGAPAAGRAGAGQRLAFVAQLRSVLAVPWARVVLASVMAEGVFLLGPMAYIPAYLHRRYGVSLATASALIALYAVGGLLYAMTARRIVQRFGEWRMVLCGGIVMGAGYLAWLAVPWWGFAGPTALLVGFGTYLFHNTLQTHATQMAPAVRGTAVALFAFHLFVGQAIGVTIAGATFDHLGFVPLLLGPAIALPLAGWGFAAALRRRQSA
jgi:predicted MFS family arabinose efflux permease